MSPDTAGGGGAGGNGANITAATGNITNAISITGGNGGNGGRGTALGGGGGGGGYGMVLTAAGLINQGTITGGNGGAGAIQGLGGAGVRLEGTSVILNNSGTITGGIGAAGVQFAGANATVINSGTISGGSGGGIGILLSNGGTIQNTGSIAGQGGAAIAGSGAVNLSNSGTIVGIVSLGAGNDSVTINTGGVFTGTVDGGAGADIIALATTSTATQRTTVNGSQFVNFEALSNTSGVNQLSGSLSVGNLNVDGGQLIGMAGSIIIGTVNVAASGSFGSAGSVIGTLAVNAGGTLSPGDSLGILTVSGNLLIGNGSTTTFEFAPTGQSDQIIVNGGSVTIGTATTVNLTGSLTPGASRDLIIVNGGGTISGNFTTVIRDAGIVGVLRNNGTVLQLLGIFVAPTNISIQANAGVTYINNLLSAGTASSALIASVPILLDGSSADAAAFNLVTGEAYASATQFGVQQGLAIAKASRTRFASPQQSNAGLFSFAQGLGDWKRLKGNDAIGTSSARSSGYGFLGGLGFGSAAGSIGAFVGYLDGRQTIANLGAQTDADGLIAGLSGHIARDGFSFVGTVARDWSEAKTGRSIPGVGSVISGKYRLRSWIIDASASFDLPISENFTLAPEVGVTQISTRRGSTSETGSAAFGLDVEAGKTNATFIDGGIKLKGGSNPSSELHPWLQLGVRHQLRGEVSAVSTGFVGNVERFTTLGAGRKKTVGTVGIGTGFNVSNGVSLFGGYLGEIGDGQNHNISLGASVSF